MKRLTDILPKSLAALGAATLLAGCPQPAPDPEPEAANTIAPTTNDQPAQLADSNSPFDTDPAPAAPQPAIVEASFAGGGALEDAVADASGGDLDRARRAFEGLVDDPELGGYANYNLGVVAFRGGDAAGATRYFERALDVDPDLAPPLVALVRMDLRAGDRGGARRRVNAQSAASDAAPQIRAAELYVMLDESRYEDVIRTGRELLLEDEENLDVFFTMANAYLRTDRPALAEYIVDQAIGRDNSRAEFQMLRAQIRIDNENYSGAQTVLESLLAQDPYHAEAHNNLGVVRLRLRNYSRAEESFDSAIAYAPTYAAAWLNLGNARKGQQNYNGAEQAFQRALELDPQLADAYFNLAILYLDAEMGDLTKIQRLEQSLAYFDQFNSTASDVPSDHPYHQYRAEAQGLLDTEIELQNQADDWGDSGGDDWGDSGGDDWGDDWGDDSGGDDWGDDWGDDGGGDDWGDGGGDDWGDAEDEESDESGDDAPADDGWDDSGSDDGWDDSGSDDDWEDPW